VIASKFLRAGRSGPFSRVAWPAPAGGATGRLAGGPQRRPRLRERVHACRVEDLPEWLDAELWRVELDSDVAVDSGKLVADRGRLLARVDAWDAEAAAALAEDCTLHARDSALAVLDAGPQRTALERCASAAQLEARASTSGLAGREARAVGYVVDTARHAIAAPAEPAEAPTHAAVNGFIAAHAAAFAAAAVAAVPREHAAQARWLAQRLALESG
jgi:hypothetical protein